MFVRPATAVPTGCNARERRRVRRLAERVATRLETFSGAAATSRYRLCIRAPVAPNALALAASSVHTIRGATYASFESHADMMAAIASAGIHGWKQTSVIDPYAVSVTCPAVLPLLAVTRHFEEFGTVSIVARDCATVVVTYFHRASQLVCMDQRSHVISGVACGVQPVYVHDMFEGVPRPWSPARQSASFVMGHYNIS